MSLSKLTSAELTHVFEKQPKTFGTDKTRSIHRNEEGEKIVRCGPCGKYCTCTSQNTDDRGIVHRRVCCQCVLRPSRLWSYPLRRIMCPHSPPYRIIAPLLTKGRPARQLSDDETTGTLETAVEKPTIREESWDSVEAEANTTQTPTAANDTWDTSEPEANERWSTPVMNEASWAETQEPASADATQASTAANDTWDTSEPQANERWSTPTNETWDEAREQTSWANATQAPAANDTWYSSEPKTNERRDAEVTGCETPRVVVVDVQYFKDDENRIIVKELTAVEVLEDDGESERVAPFKTIMWTVVLPPFTFNDLSERVYGQYLYVSECYHGLSWDEGVMRADDAFKLLRSVINGEDEERGKKEVVILTSGAEKAKFLSDKVSNGRVVDYSEISLKRMTLPSGTPLCPTHSKMSGDFTCALKNCFKIAAHYRSTGRQIQ